jgi:hypothetical protein
VSSYSYSFAPCAGENGNVPGKSGRAEISCRDIADKNEKRRITDAFIMLPGSGSGIPEEPAGFIRG